MSGPQDDTRSRRVEDTGTRRGRLLARWRRWKDVVIAAVLLPTAALTIWASLEVRSQSAATAHAAKVSCQRALVLGPPLADYYARDPAFPVKVLAEYRRTIPKSCPK